MGLEKVIKYKKEKRKPYRKGKAVDKQCRNNGGNRKKRQCQWCLDNRLYQYKKQVERCEYRDE